MFARLFDACLNHGYRTAFAATLLLSLPTLALGFWMDDYFHLMTLAGYPSMATPFDLYCFASGNPEDLRPFIERGPIPWFALPELHLHFFRPLASAVQWLDFRLFGNWPFPYHVHAILWYLALVGAAALVVRQALPAGLAPLALLLYAIDEAHALPVAWLANRNALIAIAPAFFGLAAYLRWREHAWRPGLPLALLGMTAGLCGGESAIGVFAYFLAYELLGARGPIVRRIAALSPIGLLFLAYTAWYSLAGYGAHGSGVYIDPLRSPVDFIIAAPHRILALFACQLFNLPPEPGLLRPELAFIPWITGPLAVLILAAALRWAWPRLDPGTRRGVAWMALAGFLSLAPVLATFASSRLLLVPSLGGAVVLAAVIRAWWITAPGAPRPLVHFGRAFALLHIAAAPAGWLLTTVVLAYFAHLGMGIFTSAELDNVEPGVSRVVVVDGGDIFTGFYTSRVRAYLGYPDPAVWQTLTVHPYPQRLCRTGPNSVEIEVIGGNMLSTLPEMLMRDPRFPFKPGDQVRLDGLTVSVLAVNDAGPTRIGCTFDWPLEDPRYVFLTFKHTRLRRLTLPPPGECMDLPATNGLLGLPIGGAETIPWPESS